MDDVTVIEIDLLTIDIAASAACCGTVNEQLGQFARLAMESSNP